MKVKKAVIPAAGLGTRFLPVTKSVPKEMLPIVDKPTIQYIIEEIVDSGIQEILIITGRNKDIITNHFDNVPELEFNLKMKGKTEELKMIEDITNMARIFTLRQGICRRRALCRCAGGRYCLQSGKACPEADDRGL